MEFSPPDSGVWGWGVGVGGGSELLIWGLMPDFNFKICQCCMSLSLIFRRVGCRI